MLNALQTTEHLYQITFLLYSLPWHWAGTFPKSIEFSDVRCLNFKILLVTMRLNVKLNVKKFIAEKNVND